MPVCKPERASGYRARQTLVLVCWVGWRVKKMQKLLEVYEMVSLNDAVLSGNEKMAILKARIALHIFARAMESFNRGSSAEPRPAAAVASLRMAA